MPELDFSVVGAEALPFSAVPAIVLKLHIVNRDPQPVRSVSLTTQVRIAAARRPYSSAEQSRLMDLFGAPAQWGQTLKSLLWTVGSIQVPAFESETTVDLPVPCTYDFEVVSAKYFHALDETGGQVPLELLFSGTIFFNGANGLQVEQISWNKEASFVMPVRVWKDVMRLYFPNSAWLRLHADTLVRLQHYRTQHALPTWDATLDRLLESQEPALLQGAMSRLSTE